METRTTDLAPVGKRSPQREAVAENLQYLTFNLAGESYQSGGRILRGGYFKGSGNSRLDASYQGTQCAGLHPWGDESARSHCPGG